MLISHMGNQVVGKLVTYTFHSRLVIPGSKRDASYCSGPQSIKETKGSRG